MEHDNIFNELKRREALRENEPELRSLKQKLNNEIVRKTQQCQIKEREYALLRDKIAKSREDSIIIENISKDLKYHLNEVNELNKTKKSYGNDLQLQIQVKESLREKENKMKELERLETQRMLDNLTEEYNISLQKKKQFIEQLQKEREILKQAREVEKRKIKLLSLEESKRIEQINRELEERLKKQEDEHRNKLELRESLNRKIAQNLNEQMKAKMERQKLIESLQEYEFKMNAKIADTNANKKDENKIKSYRSTLEKQIEANHAREKMLKDLEQQYKIQLLNEIRTQKQYEDLQAQFEKQKQFEYGQDIKEQMSRNLDKQKETENLIAMTNDYIKQFNATREQQIEKEKRQMILEHKQKFSSK